MASIIEAAAQLNAISILNAMNIIQNQAFHMQGPHVPLVSNFFPDMPTNDFIMALNNGPFPNSSTPYPAYSHAHNGLQLPCQFPQFLPDQDVIRSSAVAREFDSPLPPCFLSNPCTRLGPSALGHPSLWLSPTTGEFDHLLYNFLLMATIDRKMATEGLIKRLQTLRTLAPNGDHPAPVRASSSTLTDPGRVAWSTGSARSSTQGSRREPRRGGSQTSQLSSSSAETNKIIQHSPLSRDLSP